MQAIKNMPLSEENNLMVILGPTASGKTTLAVQLAREFDGEIISADSRQVYRGMDLGTGKDLSEYHFANKPIPYHLIDIMDPREEFNLFQFQQCFAAVYKDIIERRKVPLLVGGTGMYLESIILNYQLREVPEDLTFREEMKTLDMDSLMQLYITERSGTPHNKTDMTDHHRLVRAIEISKYGHKEPDATIQAVLGKLSPFVIGVRWERSILRKRISQRLHDRLARGMIDEVKRLKDQGLSWERLDAFGLEYRFIAAHLQGRLTYEEMLVVLETKIHQFAKRQETWFRKMERKGVKIHWVTGNDYSEVRRLAKMILS